MKNGMSLQALLEEVIRQKGAKVDFIANTKDQVRMVPASDVADGVAVVLLRDGHEELQRFGLTQNAHDQIADKLGIPKKFYDRLLHDHKDMVIDNVNKLFEREPASRMFRALDGKVRAFLSDRYLRLDNHEVLQQTLPAIVKGEVQTRLLSSNVGEKHMDLKVLFTDKRFEQPITSNTRTGQSRIVSPGFRMRNSETGHGSLSIQGFFYDGYCNNGCIYGMVEGFEYSRTHLGGKLIQGVDFEILSEKSRRLEDETIVSQVTDVMKAMASVEFAQKMGDALRATANTPQSKNPSAVVEQAVKVLGIRESEKTSLLETFLQDGDYSQWGLASAVTSVANKDETSYERAGELEDIGGKILSLSLPQWRQLAQLPLAA